MSGHFILRDCFSRDDLSRDLLFTEIRDFTAFVEGQTPQGKDEPSRSLTNITKNRSSTRTCSGEAH